MLLDEVDKMSTDFRGDPSAALLEVLDPEQNHTFSDHYLDLDYDLSKVMFICTRTRCTRFPAPLQDRMEVIRIAGYTEDEKMSIAKKYLVPKQREANGLADVPVKITRSAISRRHQPVHLRIGRALARARDRVDLPQVARDVLKNGKREITVDRKMTMKLLGVRSTSPGRKEKENQVGLVTGLCVTQAGGDTLATEATLMPGKAS